MRLSEKEILLENILSKILRIKNMSEIKFCKPGYVCVFHNCEIKECIKKH